MPVRLSTVVAITILGLVIRLYHLDFQSLWRDEVDVLLFSSRDLNELLRNFLKQGENGPLYYVFHHYWLALSGDSEVALRLPSAIFGTAAIPVIYNLGRELLDPKSAILAALLSALSPYYVWYSQDAKMYPLLLLLTALSFLLYLRAIRDGGARYWLGYVAVTTLALYVHFFTALVILTQVVLFLIFYRNRWKIRWATSMGVLTLPYLPLAAWQIPVLLSPPDSAYPSVSPSGVASMLLILFVRGLSPVLPMVPMVLAIFLLLAAVLYYGKSGAGRSGTMLSLIPPGKATPLFWHAGISILLVWLLAPLIAFLLISARLPLFTDRYLIIVTPAFYLLVAAGFISLRQQWRIAFWVALSFWFATVLYSLAWQTNTSLKPDFRSAAAFFSKNAGPEDLAIFNMPYLHYTFKYYFRDQVNWVSAPYTNDGREAASVGEALGSELSGVSQVWMIASEEEQWDGRGLVREWLQTNLTVVQRWEGTGVYLEQYRHP